MTTKANELPHPSGAGKRRNSRKRVESRRVLESNGCMGRICGTAGKIREKYLSYAKESKNSVDEIKQQFLLQHAEHYFRVERDSKAQHRNHNDNNGQNGNQESRASKTGSRSKPFKRPKADAESGAPKTASHSSTRQPTPEEQSSIEEQRILDQQAALQENVNFQIPSDRGKDD